MPLSKIDDPQRLRRLLDAVLVIERDLSLRVVLETLVRESCMLAAAQYAALGVLDDSGSSLREFITYGMDPAVEGLIPERPTGRGVLGVLITDAKPIRIKNVSGHPLAVGFPPNHPPMTSFLGVPISVGERVFGNLYLTNKLGAEEFDQDDETLISYLARAAAIAIENARLQSAVADYAMRADRERIARELHDEIIQRLFAIGLSLQATMRLIIVPEAATRVQAAIDDLDEAIKRIRATIFALETSRERFRESFRARVLALVREMQPVLGFEASVTFSGPLDTLVDPPLSGQVLQVVREALSNVAKHAQASTATVSLRAATDELTVVVEDNGRGLVGERSASSRGIGNMESRARDLGGSFDYGSSASLGGTFIRWSVPL
ncbi:MAG: GAF domain-containing sensor histidine kinase [Actinomycetota bacterium]|nr:GAF domain-containing sensor histidine kinase [Actinomycetota bacterium]